MNEQKPVGELVQLEGLPDVRARATELGCPNLADLTLLPLNFDSAERIEDFQYLDMTATIRKLWRSENLPEVPLEADVLETQRISFHDDTIFLPWIFVAWQLISDNPVALQVALNLISAYIYDVLRRSPNDVATLRIAVEREDNSTCVWCSYTGPVEGLKDLDRTVKEAAKAK